MFPIYLFINLFLLLVLDYFGILVMINLNESFRIFSSLFIFIINLNRFIIFSLRFLRQTLHWILSMIIHVRNLMRTLPTSASVTLIKQIYLRDAFPKPKLHTSKRTTFFVRKVTNRKISFNISTPKVAETFVSEKIV